MRLTIDISDDVEAVLRAEWGDLNRAAKESLLIESYRTGKISIGYLARALGFSRWDAEHWLAERGVAWNYGPEDLEADRLTLEALHRRDH